MENKKINIAKLLKNCPKGMKLDCAMFEDVELDCVIDGDKYPIKIIVKDGAMADITIPLTKEGYYSTAHNPKCIIFPRGKASWEGFVPPVEFKDGDVIHCSYKYGPVIHSWVCILAGKVVKTNATDPNFYAKYYCSLNNKGIFFNTFDYFNMAENVRLATEDEKERLFQAIKDNGYKWDAERKVLRKKDITIQDLYNWAKDRYCLDYKIRIQYRDDGGDYPGSDKEVYLDVNEEDKTIIL